MMVVPRSRWFVLCAALLMAAFARAQFSPGELSRAHMALEGSTNCTQCHELGKEINGNKCLTCHTEIASARAARHGYHFSVAARQCVECHKEHLGRDSKTVRFDSANFDHRMSGFALGGKHAALRCGQCHSPDHLKDPTIVAVLEKNPHRTFLGLKTACASCHADPHSPGVKQDCGGCHSPESWNSVSRFNHSAARFPLSGKHASMDCAKCHAEFKQIAPGSGQKTNLKVSFGTKPFADCAPCHTSPHKLSMSPAACSSCHDPAGWNVDKTSGFNHDRTAFPLAGAHRTVQCARCHGGGGTTVRNGARMKNLHPKHGLCVDCHRDPHNGVIRSAKNNDCKDCHSERAFVPSTWTMDAHASSRFPLTGSHVAVQCALCHRPEGSKNSRFRIEGTRCSNCHADYHKGQFASAIAKSGCEGCHSTSEWKIARFDHAGTGFTLDGKHASVSCSKCHDARDRSARTSVRRCEDCHADRHNSQFAGVDSGPGVTACSRCHATAGWHELKFNHETQSKFPLTGAHKQVPCGRCHKEVRAADPAAGGSAAAWVLYKPVDSRCESCHAGGAK